MTSIHQLPKGDAGSPTPSKDYRRRVRIACGDVHDHPLDEAARMRELLSAVSPTAVLRRWER
jgi:hypothetical protein